MTVPSRLEPERPALRRREHLLDRVEDRIDGLISAERARWSRLTPRAAVPVEAVRELLAAGGKRLRPAFCITGFLAAGGDADDPAIVDVAAGLELLHAFALIHDDVMDESPVRRGRPTVHTRYAADHAARRWHGQSRRFGENVAIVAGDLAMVYADRFLAGAPGPVSEVWGELRSELMIGQFLDIAAAAEHVMDPELARWIAVCKSGRYTIHRPLVLGAALAERLELAAGFEEYGTALGEAFQLRDDLIGAFGRPEVAGKPVGLDLEQGKLTLLMALAGHADERVHDLLVDARGGRAGPALRALFAEIGIQATAERAIDRLVATACAALAGTPIDGIWREELERMAVKVAYRDR